ncbi:hypothetical protein D4764_15G0000370 [Takifugu flavidus]|uniref:Murine leukemia virus integrase C-terminal domain-containing protein n=1 Tax=Takifugu flavidus TaxID=433684 RepID=A0A5C6NZD7_9TELE|nr:hypothetical protein D4764_15G0000370 [Takifugu flavidus]
MAVVLSQLNLTIRCCTTLNPATLLPTAEEGHQHNCLDEVSTKVLPRPDLSDVALTTGQTLFVDGSSRKDDCGRTRTAYAVVTATEVVEAKSLPSSYSAQAAELIALTRAYSTPQEPIQPGDYVWVKKFVRKRWNTPRWEGPYQVQLTTKTAVRVDGKLSWIHLSHCKKQKILPGEGKGAVADSP